MERHSKSGQALLESVVAITILTFGVIGVFTLLSAALGFNRITTNEYVATALAAEGIEIVRNILDANTIQGNAWNLGVGDGDKEADYDDAALVDSTSRFLKFDSTTGFYGYYASGVDTIFKRNINISSGGSPIFKITVKSTVTWKDKNLISYSVALEDELYDWR